MTHRITIYIANKALLISVALLALLLLNNSLFAQTIQSKNKITLPETGSNKVIAAGAKITYISAQEIEIVPNTAIEAGADVDFKIGQVTGDATMNWRLTRVLGATGTPAYASKSYYDERGSILQVQQLNFSTGQVLAKHIIKDNLGRSTILTLAAPIGKTDFEYKSDFVQNSSGSVYNAANFDGAKKNNPDPVGNTVSGTLGWYYSNNNTLEPFVAASGYPYSRIDFYDDGSGKVKRIAGPGDAYKLNSGHEVRDFQLPVGNELTNYFLVRNKFFTGAEIGALPTALSEGAIKTINRNADGKETIAIMDKNGNTLITAVPGTDLSVTNSNNFLYGVIYFYLSSPSVVTLDGNFPITIYNMGTDEKAVTFTSGNSLPAGYYKAVRGPAPSGPALQPVITYTTGLSEMSYYFYNQLGQLIAHIPPEGVKKLLNGNINAYASKTDIPYITLSEYDLKGRLRANVHKEKGRTEFVYRTDGREKFAQNAVQRSTGAYLYDLYDQTGRLTESGEFQPSAGGVSFNVNGMGIEDDMTASGGLGNGVRRNWIKSIYDIPQSTGLAGYVQDDIALSGALSYTENVSGAKTWFNYNEVGQLLWMVQDIPGLGKKTIDYSYNYLGGIAKIVFQKSTPLETFVHYYEYDADQQLSAVYTNTIDNPATRVQQAKYYYYLHGALKRMELGNKVQGIDYTYTLQGNLKAINHASKDLDPGKDGISGANAGFAPDAFGMNLEYYSGDYTRANSGFQSIPLTNTVADDQYSGNLKAMGWYSRKPQSVIVAQGIAIENPTMYGYKYDNNYQLTSGTWGTPNYTVPGFAANTAFKEYNLSYDLHGNIKSLARTNSAGAVTDNFTYNYLGNSNQLQSVVNGSTAYSNYTYNTLGQLTAETPASGPARYIKYNADGRVSGVYGDAAFTQPKINFIYNERGVRVSKIDYVNNTTTYYTPDLSGSIVAIYSQAGAGSGSTSQVEVPLYGDSRLGIYRKGTQLSEYELSDNLGNVRVVIDQNKTIKNFSDYYPFGYVARDGGTLDYRFGYQGQFSEKDKETGWNSFDLRMYDARIGRWISPDPANQFHSPYVGMGNNPVNGVDPDGAYSWFGAQWRALFWGGTASDYKVNGEYSVTYGGYPWGGDRDLYGRKIYVSRTQSSGDRQLFGFAEASQSVDDMNTKIFWEKEVAEGRIKFVESRWEALASWATFAIPGGKLLGPAAAGELTLMAEGTGIVANETKAVFGQVVTDAAKAAEVGTQVTTTAEKINPLKEILAAKGMSSNEASQFFGWGKGPGGIYKKMSDFTREGLLAAGWDKESLVKLARAYNKQLVKAKVGSKSGLGNPAAEVRRDFTMEIVRFFFK